MGGGLRKRARRERKRRSGTVCGHLFQRRPEGSAAAVSLWPVGMEESLPAFPISRMGWDNCRYR